MGPIMGIAEDSGIVANSPLTDELDDGEHQSCYGNPPDLIS
jgi:hypothetical protein